MILTCGIKSLRHSVFNNHLSAVYTHWHCIPGTCFCKNVTTPTVSLTARTSTVGTQLLRNKNVQMWMRVRKHFAEMVADTIFHVFANMDADAL